MIKSKFGNERLDKKKMFSEYPLEVVELSEMSSDENNTLKCLINYYPFRFVSPLSPEYTSLKNKIDEIISRNVITDYTKN